MLKHWKVLVIVSTLVILSICVFASCKRNTVESSPMPEATDPIAENTETPPGETSDGEPGATANGESAVTPKETEASETMDVENSKEIPIYSVNDETMEKEPTMALIPKESEVTPRIVVDEVVANFQEKIGISEVLQDGERIIVCFKDGMAPMSRVSSKMENNILDCIAFSLIDNIEDCSEVVFRGENGNRYESGHMVFELDEVYVSE